MLESSALHVRARNPTPPARLTLALLAACTVAACAAAPAGGALDRLGRCASDEGPIDGYCGTFRVFEDRDAAAGREIDLWIVVLPALSPAPQPDPLVFLAGGPGQGAAQLADQIEAGFSRVQRSRDIVLVDQRGTGRSGPLDCGSDSSTLRELTEGMDASLVRLRSCLDGYDADVRLYTTDIAMDDLDDVRAHLGYERVNLYGGSYGTRAALVYLRRHGEHVRSVILDGAAPTDMRLPLFMARDAERALDRLLADCESSRSCRDRYPGLGDRIRTLLARLAGQPARVTVTHPRTHEAEAITVEARVVAGILFRALYSPLTASLVPALVERAEQDDYGGLFALALAGGGGENMSIGMQLSVLCSEDAPLVTRDDVSQATAGTTFGLLLMGNQLDACDMWPRRVMDPGYARPVESDVPALVLSGELDPVTPPSWGERVVEHLSRGRHVAVPATGHGVISTPCGMRMVQAFLDAASADELDTSCVERLQRPPFFVSPAGPDPAPADPTPTVPAAEP